MTTLRITAALLLAILILTSCATLQAELLSFAQWALTHRGTQSWSDAWQSYIVWRLTNGHSRPSFEVEIPPMLIGPRMGLMTDPNRDELATLLARLRAAQ